jgi:hypothetical protein
MEPDPDRYFLKLAAAFVRGRYAIGRQDLLITGCDGTG